MERNKIYVGDALEVLKTFPNNSIHCCITSPPYFGLRDYGTANWVGGDETCNHTISDPTNNNGKLGDRIERPVSVHRGGNPDECSKCGAKRMDSQIGLEKSPQEYIQKLVEVFTEVYRVLRKDGTLWLNLGDSMATGAGGKTSKTAQVSHTKAGVQLRSIVPEGMRKKNLIGIPWRVAFALQDAGWNLRQDIIWTKPNSMPECLDPATEILIKENDFIKVVNLDYLLNNSIKGVLIASPNGWKKILNVWETSKSPFKVTINHNCEVTCSEDHKFPISNDSRRSSTICKKVSDIKIGHRCDYLLWSSIDKIIGDGNTKFSLLNSSIPSDLYVSVKKFHDDYKKCIINKYGSLIEWSNFHGYVVKRRGRERLSQLFNKFRAGFIPLSVYNLDNFLIKIDGVRWKNSDSLINDRIDLDYNAGYFLGLYAADGGHSRSSGVNFSFNLTEREYVEFVVKWLKKFNVTSRIESKNYYRVYFSNGCIQNFIDNFVYGKCKYKSLNLNLILNSSCDFRRGIWDGYVSGDGHITKYGSVSATSSSFQLIKDFKYIASSIGLFVSVYNYEREDNRTGIVSKFYTIKVINRRVKKNSICRQVKPITKKLISNCPIRMVDIEVDGGLFLINGGIVSHNSVMDRCTNSHEYLFLLTKSKKYYFDIESIKEPIAQSTIKRFKSDYIVDGTAKYQPFDKEHPTINPNTEKKTRESILKSGLRRKRSVWSISTVSFSGAHFATYPPSLIEPCVFAGTSEKGCCSKCGSNFVRVVKSTRIRRDELDKDDPRYRPNQYKGSYDEINTMMADGGYNETETLDWVKSCKCEDVVSVPCVVLDPFIGSGVTGMVAKKFGRDYVGIDLDSRNVEMSYGRIEKGYNKKKLVKNRD